MNLLVCFLPQASKYQSDHQRIDLKSCLSSCVIVIAILLLGMEA